MLIISSICTRNSMVSFFPLWKWSFCLWLIHMNEFNWHLNNNCIPCLLSWYCFFMVVNIFFSRIAFLLYGFAIHIILLLAVNKVEMCGILHTLFLSIEFCIYSQIMFQWLPSRVAPLSCPRAFNIVNTKDRHKYYWFKL